MIATGEAPEVLLVEDSPADADLVTELLVAERVPRPAIVHVERMADACDAASSLSPRCVVLDLHLPDAEGFESLRAIRAAAPDVPVVVLTGAGDDDASGALGEGAQDYLLKQDADGRTLRRAIRHAVERHRCAAREIAPRDDAAELTSRVAHDFNNFLAAITTHCDVAARTLGERTDGAAAVAEIRRAAEHAHDLSRRLVEAGGRAARAAEVVDLNVEVRRDESLMRTVLGAGVALELALSDPLPPVRVAPAQLESILLNLAFNARDAMPDGGRLAVVTRVVTPAGGRRYVQLAVRDTGCGMSPEVAERAFDLFFSTKPEAGSGVGLANVRAAVSEAGGRISLDSRPGAGTTVEIGLPAASAARTAVEGAGDGRA